MKGKYPLFAALLSLVPGAGHLYIGRYRKAAALFCIDAGLIAGHFYFHSRLTLVLSVMIYVVTAGPALAECFIVAKYGSTRDWLAPKAYVILLLLTTGFTALPLLWQDARFSRKTKIAWTIAVPLLALAFFTTLAFMGRRIEAFLERF